jgi:hypothetical protein
MQGVTERCTSCGFVPSAVSDEQLGPELLQRASGYEASLVAAESNGVAFLAARPTPEQWSILEYVGHVVGVYDTLVAWIEVAVSEDRPVVEGVDPDAEVLAGRYNEVPPAELKERIRTAADCASGALAQLSDGALDRQLVFSGFPVPLRLLAVAMLHEAHHHLDDVNRLLAATGNERADGHPTR